MLPKLSLRWCSLTALFTVSFACMSCGAGDEVAAPSDLGSRTTVTGGHSVDGVWRAMDSGTTELLWGVAGSAAYDVISVGTRGTAIHLGGAAWVGKATGTGRDLCDVWSATDGRAICVGTGGTILGYDGSAWSPMASGTDHGLYDAWGFESFEAVAVGDSGTILHFDGTAWSPMTTSARMNLFGVWGSAPADLFAVGVGGSILHYDGSAWTFMATPTSNNLSAVWGTSSDNVWAVGDAGTIAYYNGADWTTVTSGVVSNLYDVWGSSATDVWAVGQDGRILHYDGAGWAMVTSGTDYDLFGVWGRSAEEAYAVGDNGTVLKFGPDSGDDEQTIFVCHDHPNGAASPPLYGLRLDDLIEPGHYTFSFDYADQSGSARVTLVYNHTVGSVRISGRAYGGLVENGQWLESSRGWVNIDFTYTTNLAVKDDCGALAGDDLYITGENPSNRGAITLDGWGGDLTFECADRSGEGGGCSFVFDNDTDPKSNAEIAQDLSTWSGSGWFEPHVGGSRDWLFIAREEPTSE